MWKGLLLAAAGLALAAPAAHAGDPVFAPSGQEPGGGSLHRLTEADVNRDGLRDIVLTTYDGSVTVRYARPGGGYDASGPYTVGRYPRRPLVADLDGDGHADIATANAAGGSVTVLRGSADGSFARTDYAGPPAHPDVNEIGRAEALVAADVTGDGRLDLGVASSRLNAVFVLAGTAEGFAAPVEHHVEYGPRDIAAADVTGDGRTDLVLASGSELLIMAGRPGGGLGAPVRHLDWTGELVVRDLDGDDRTDVATASGPGIAIWRGLPGGGLGARVEYALGGSLVGLRAEDLNGDGRVDLFGVTGTDGVVTGVLGLPGGDFSAPWTHSFGLRVNAEQFAVADRDDDGRPDRDELTREGSSPLPAPTPAPPPGTAPQPEVQLSFDYVPGRTSTKLLKLRLVDVKPGTTVTVRCTKGCPAKSFTKRDARGTVSLYRFASRRLKVGTTIRITIAEPGARPIEATIKIRAGRKPSVTTRVRTA